MKYTTHVGSHVGVHVGVHDTHWRWRGYVKKNVQIFLQGNIKLLTWWIDDINHERGIFHIPIDLLPVRPSFGIRIIGLHCCTNPIMAPTPPPISCMSLVWPNPISRKISIFCQQNWLFEIWVPCKSISLCLLPKIRPHFTHQEMQLDMVDWMTSYNINVRILICCLFTFYLNYFSSLWLSVLKLKFSIIFLIWLIC